MPDLHTIYRRAATTVAALAVSLAAVAVAPGSASAAPTSAKKATFGVQPTTDGKPDGRVALIEGVTPGASFTEQVAIVNFSSRPFTFSVYATNAINDDAGGLTLLPTNRRPTDAGKWLTMGGAAASGKVRVPARSSVVVPVEGRVPADASPGDHVAGIVADLAVLGTGGNANVLLHQRVGLRTFIRVAGDVAAKLSIDNLEVGYRNNWNPIGSGSAVVTYRIKNTGNVVLGARQTVTVDGLFGRTAATKPPIIPLLLPGSSVDLSVPLAGVTPEIWMSAQVTVAPIVPQGAVEVAARPVSASTHFWAVPWVLIGIVILLAGGAVWFWRWRRRIKNSPGRHSTPRKSVSRATAGVGA